MNATTTIDATPVYPEIDFALDDVLDFHERMDALRTAGERVVPVRYYGQIAWLILRHDDTRAAYRDNATFPCSEAYQRHSAQAMGDKMLLALDGEEHRVKRLLISRALLPQKIPAIVDRHIQPLANELVDAFAGARAVDVVERFTRPLPMYLITRLLGLPDGEGAQLIKWVEALFSFDTAPEQALAARAEVTEFLQPVINARRTEPRDDLISLLATAEVEGEKLDDEDILSFARLLFPAGSDTTYLTMGSMINAVLADPSLHRQLLTQPELRPAAVEESLRLFGTVALQNRFTVSGCEMHGVRIPPQSWVLFGNAPGNHDPEVFADPHRFDLTRNHKPMLTFGGGPHVCIGAHLARATLLTGLSTLLDRLPGLRLAGQPVTPAGAILRGVRHLPVAFDTVLPAQPEGGAS
ncbi:putative cytochrome P450 [Caenibius tardaugens NBRC 16725]|uniref:Putative cytochrome P450 n=1 Tax=Caenibius tardaugens NBRC 16725 TaxID=1219035 RepID=U2YK17_9SPHN|nr:cytochrome P450 [Caenibius tardaugens]AZI36282.1 cytochrome P450 [Caenibius tardaugens NBRC 16725]GAD48602.1 putative cytochrome P450 [Caenibius tardaugens NBRC 16725]